MMRPVIRTRVKFILIIYGITALFAPLISNDRPLYARISGENFFPAFTRNAYLTYEADGGQVKMMMSAVNWNAIPATVKIFPPVRWAATSSDLKNMYASPFGVQYADEGGAELPWYRRHFLGTGRLGNDTFAALIHGTRTSIFIGLFSIAIATVIGVITGFIAGYIGNYTVSVSRLQCVLLLLMILPAWFYGIQLREGIIEMAFGQNAFYGLLQLSLSILIVISIILLPAWLAGRARAPKKIFIPFDSIISRLMEVFVSIPRLILILTIAAIVRPSVSVVIILIGFTSWTEIARVVRSQLIQLKHSAFIEAAQLSGMNQWQIFLRHLVPNIRQQVIAIGIFGVAAAILTETGLSFLGIGVPAGTATWGQIMFEARQNFTAWWLVLFSGLAIAVLLFTLYSLSFSQRKENPLY